jgi:RNA-directed DNA polymerase
MTDGQKPTGASSTKAATWKQINWDQADADVKRLQMRIAKAMRERRYGKVKALQWLLTRSFHAKAVAVKRVTGNTGAKTPGTDGDVWVTPEQKMAGLLNIKRRGYQPLPLRRIYIPKKNGKKRPLSIPTLTCRSCQALHLLALEPVTETLADPNSYGFRSKRSCIDAIQQTKLNLGLANRSQWILEGDIKSCFDRISHPWLLDNVPMDKVMLQKWLKAGYLEKSQLFPTNEGTPQGGIISPTLLVITLAGLEKSVKAATRLKDKVNVVVYADDFIITGASKEILEDKVKPAVIVFLKERGLELSEEKTKITHIEEGFDFLGFNVRKYKGKLLIKPSKAGVKNFLQGIRAVIKANKAS